MFTERHAVETTPKSGSLCPTRVVIDGQKHGNSVSVGLYADVNQSCLCEKLCRVVTKEGTKLVGNSNAPIRGVGGLLPVLDSPTHSHILSRSLPPKRRSASPSPTFWAGSVLPRNRDKNVLVVDPWGEVEKNKRIAESYLNESHRGPIQLPPAEVLEGWEPDGLPVQVWAKNWGAQLIWQLFYIGFGIVFTVTALNGISRSQAPIAVLIFFVLAGLLAVAIGFGAMLVPMRRAERFDDGTFVFSRGSKRLVVRPGELRCLDYVYGGRWIGRPYPLAIESRRGDHTLAVLSNMQGFLDELKRQNPKASLGKFLDWDT